MGLKEKMKKAFRIVFRTKSYLLDQNKQIQEQLARLEQFVREDPRWAEAAWRQERTEEKVTQIARQFAYVNPEYISLPQDTGTRVLICGYYGDYNLGDELMLDTLLSYLEEIPGLSLTVMLADNENYVPYERSGVHFIHYPRTRFDFDVLSSHFDAVIFGGGALLDDGDYDLKAGIELTLVTTVLELSAEMVEKGKKCLWIGLSSNHEIRNPRFIERIRTILPKLSYCSFRDVRSIRSLEEAGIDVSGVTLDHDIILAAKELYDVPTCPHEETRVGITFMTGFPGLEEPQRQVIEKLLRRLEGEGKPYRVDLIPFFGRTGFDEENLKRLASELNDPHVTVRPFVKRFDQIVAAFAEQDRIISTRYHGTLLALLLRKPVLGLVYDIHAHYPNKMAYVREKYDNKTNNLNLSRLNDQDVETAFDTLFSEKEGPDNAAFMAQAREKLASILREQFS